MMVCCSRAAGINSGVKHGETRGGFSRFYTRIYSGGILLGVEVHIRREDKFSKKEKKPQARLVSFFVVF